jgi:putative lipoprotein
MNLRPLLVLLFPLCTFAADTPVTYTCDNGSRIDISFSADISGRPQATLHFSDESVVLPQVPAAAGAFYRSNDIRLHTQGDEAVFEDGKNNLRRCSRGSVPPVQPHAAAQPVASSFIEVSGNVSYLSRIALPRNAILRISIRSGKRTLAEQRYELNGTQVPIPFSTTVDRDMMNKKAGTTVTARIEADGKLLFAGSKAFPVLKNQAIPPVDIILKPASHAKTR